MSVSRRTDRTNDNLDRTNENEPSPPSNFQQLETTVPFVQQSSTPATNLSNSSRLVFTGLLASNTSEQIRSSGRGSRNVDDHNNSTHMGEWLALQRLRMERDDVERRVRMDREDAERRQHREDMLLMLQGVVSVGQSIAQIFAQSSRNKRTRDEEDSNLKNKCELKDVSK